MGSGNEFEGRGGGGGAPPERCTFFRLDVYKRAGISWAAVEMDREKCHLGIKKGLLK